MISDEEFFDLSNHLCIQKDGREIKRMPALVCSSCRGGNYVIMEENEIDAINEILEAKYETPEKKARKEKYWKKIRAGMPKITSADFYEPTKENIVMFEISGTSGHSFYPVNNFEDLDHPKGRRGKGWSLKYFLDFHYPEWIINNVKQQIKDIRMGK